jgi:DNA-binding beta-propeller fold protein YncE
MLPACDRKPNDPDDPIKPKEFVFWSTNDARSGPGDTWIFRYEPSSGRFDTLHTTFTATGSFGELTASADGERLYMPVAEGGTVVLQTDSLQPVSHLSNGGHIAVSPDGRFVVFSNSQGIRILHTRDYSLYKEVAIPAFRSFFDAASRYLYGITLNSGGNLIYKFDIHESNPEITEIRVPHGSPVRIAPLKDGTRLLVYLQYHTFDYAFADYSLEADSFLTWLPFTPGAGNIVLSADESIAIVTNPGSLLIGPPAPSSFLVYDLRTLDLDSVDTKTLVPDSLAMQLPVNDVAIAPDNSIAVLTAKVGGTLIQYDLKTKAVTDYLWAGNGVRYNGMTCRLKP